VQVSYQNLILESVFSLQQISSMFCSALLSLMLFKCTSHILRHMWFIILQIPLA